MSKRIFTANTGIAQNTIEAALEASGQFNAANALAVATALTAAGHSSVVDWDGIVETNNTTLTPSNAISIIDGALHTPAAEASIQNSSLTNFTSAYNALNELLANSPLQNSVESALADPTQGPLLEIVLQDYNNQYPSGITSDGPMMKLLTTGSVTLQSGVVVTLNATNAATVTQSVMTFALDTGWIAKNITKNGAVACNRLANDVQAATAYDQAQGVATPGNETLTSAYGQCTITPGSNGTGFTGSWSGGSVSGYDTESGSGDYITVTGTDSAVAMNGDAISMNSGAQATVDGSYNNIVVPNGAALTLSGLGNSLTLDVGGSVTAGNATTLPENSVAFAIGNGSVLTLDAGGGGFSLDHQLFFRHEQRGACQFRLGLRWGTLAFNGTSGSAMFTLTDGAPVPLPAIANETLVAPTAGGVGAEHDAWLSRQPRRLR